MFAVTMVDQVDDPTMPATLNVQSAQRLTRNKLMVIGFRVWKECLEESDLTKLVLVCSGRWEYQSW